MATQDSSQASVAEGFRMIDVGAKNVTVRTAWAEGRIYLSPIVLEKILNKSLPKGDPLPLAEIAGIMAAKNTALMIPLCHPLPLDAVYVRCRVEQEQSTVSVEAEVRATAKTGVEMEALCAVQAALLTIYDLCKGTDAALTIGAIRLKRKEGGKQGLWIHPELVMEGAESKPLKLKLQDVRIAVVTISDSCFEGKAEDRSGPLLRKRAEEQGAIICGEILVPDEVDAIRQAVTGIAENQHADLIFCTGGTGLAQRDRTPEALEPLFDKPIPGFGELLRSSGAVHNPLAYLSRSGAGMLGRSLVITLPGSQKAVDEGFQALLPILPHALHIVRGGRHG